jgi:hypothetical protein
VSARPEDFTEVGFEEFDESGFINGLHDNKGNNS